MPRIAILGRYWPAESVIHRMDARAKLLFSLVMIVILFCAQNAAALGLCACFIAGSFLAARIPLHKAIASIGVLSFAIILTMLINIFFTQGGEVFFQWAFIRVSEAGVFTALFVGSRLLLLLLTVSLLTLTTTIIDITDAFERLLTPFTRIGLPAHELAMIMGIALRFVPLFTEEFMTLYRAQTSRGASFGGNPFTKGIGVLNALIVPLFNSVFRHAETLSRAMDARCYHGGVGRTRLHPLRYSKLDRNAIGFFVVLLAAVVTLNIWF